MLVQRRLSDRELFCARPWRAPDRAQVIFAVPEPAPGESEWSLVIATLHGTWLYQRKLSAPRSPASFTEAELREVYEEALENLQGRLRVVN